MTKIGLLGKKIGMTQVFNSEGDAIPVTIIQMGPCLITKIKTVKSHGYNAIQIGYQNVANKRLSKAELGHLKKLKLPCLQYLKEFKIHSCQKFHIGQSITLSEFKTGDLVDISAKSIGKGFTGYQKRHKFTRGPMSHGSKNHRQPGSIGAGTTPGRVLPGKRMAGRMGMKQTTVKNLEIVSIFEENHIALIKGSVPGKTGNLISIKSR